MSRSDIPPELSGYIRYVNCILYPKKCINLTFRINRITRHSEFLPIIQNDFLKTRINDLQEILPTDTNLKLSFNYAPIGIGKLRLLLHVEHALLTLKKLGFTKKDVDEVKGIFSDTNVYLLCGTIFVSSIHVNKITYTAYTIIIEKLKWKLFLDII